MKPRTGLLCYGINLETLLKIDNNTLLSRFKERHKDIECCSIEQIRNYYRAYGFRFHDHNGKELSRDAQPFICEYGIVAEYLAMMAGLPLYEITCIKNKIDVVIGFGPYAVFDEEFVAPNLTEDSARKALEQAMAIFKVKNYSIRYYSVSASKTGEASAIIYGIDRMAIEDLPENRIEKYRNDQDDQDEFNDALTAHGPELLNSLAEVSDIYIAFLLSKELRLPLRRIAVYKDKNETLLGVNKFWPLRYLGKSVCRYSYDRIDDAFIRLFDKFDVDIYATDSLGEHCVTLPR